MIRGSCCERCFLAQGPTAVAKDISMTDRPLGPIVPDWTAAADPAGLHLTGRYCDLRPMTSADGQGLWSVFRDAPQVWDYLYEPVPKNQEAFQTVIDGVADRRQSPAYVVRATGAADPLGYLTYFTVAQQTGSIEIGNVNFAPVLQGTRIATEAFFLMIDWAFANGYRRVEWKCNALNAPSRRAAARLGFSFEGIFRQHLVVKGRNRDTAWLAMTDGDWRDLRGAYTAWLAPENFDVDHHQKLSLAQLTRPLLAASDPSV